MSREIQTDQMVTRKEITTVEVETKSAMTTSPWRPMSLTFQPCKSRARFWEKCSPLAHPMTGLNAEETFLPPGHSCAEDDNATVAQRT